LAQKDLSRAEKLSKSGAVSKEGFDSAQAAFKSAMAAFERAKAEMDYLKLVAPEEGTIIRRDGEIGELITVGTPVFWINGGDNIRVETEVDEEDIGLVQPGQKVAISADAFPGQIFDGTVLSITPKGDPVARSYRVRVGFDGPSPLMIGMTAETNIITKEKDAALMVPFSAVSNGNIIKITNGKAENVAVKTDIKTQQAIEIVEGIAEGDTVAMKYDATLLDKGRLHGKVTDWKITEQK
ncbi:MAG: efflux RND transporter periplasmic adaptor subunit, partial [Gammaproteobacteria bacterium]|nr:efflux RND transporter periplasmic adaptor subunit [Gammaproteobacteria bacterium]